MHRLTVAVALVAVLLAGCSDTPSETDTPTPGPTTEQTDEPSPEPTDPETPQTQQQKPSISIANAPIGGDVDREGDERCAEVNWLGKSPIPDGTTIALGRARLDPGGIFEFYQSACPGDARACADVKWQSGAFEPCYVGVRQVADGTDSVVLVIPMQATCDSEQDCKSLVAGFGTSQISFEPDFLETPTTESTPTETPTNE